MRSRAEFAFVELCENTARRIARLPEPRSFKQIDQLTGIERKLVWDAMVEEMRWLIEKGKVVTRNKRQAGAGHFREIPRKWVVKYRKSLEGLLQRVRARWILRGDLQRAHLDYDQHNIYSPVASKTSTLTAFNIAVQFGYFLLALDVSKAFTCSELVNFTDEDRPGLYMKVPDGAALDDPDLCPFGDDKTWELRTTLCGLKQASAEYYKKFVSILLSEKDSRVQSYRQSHADPCVFAKGTFGSDDYIAFSTPVDDSFIATSSEKLVKELICLLQKTQL